jgi:HJR/Mrr/RecB family endonuclease
MSSNKGKVGEMQTGKLLFDIAIKEESFDVKRPTLTNESDMGADFEINSTPQELQRVFQIAHVELTNDDKMILTSSKGNVNSRMDVKTTQSKIGKDTVDKFATDVHKHPNTTVHILTGGKGLTAPAQRELNKYKAVFTQENKVLVYISNDGINKLKSEYEAIIPELDNGEND